MTSSKGCHLVKNEFFSITLLHAHVQYVSIMHAKYQGDSETAVEQVNFTAYTLSNLFVLSVSAKRDSFQNAVILTKINS